MDRRDVSRLTDVELERGFHERVHRERRLTVELLLFLGEMMRRRTFAPAGCSSMYAYCVQRCRMSADVAFRWTRAARLARRFPALLDMIEDGRLGLTAITLLAPRLDAGNAAWLLPGVAGKSTREIAALLARHWPRPDAPTVFRVLSEHASPAATTTGITSTCQELAALPVSSQVSNSRPTTDATPGDGPPERPAPAQAPAPPSTASMERRYAFQCTLDAETYALFERAKSLSTPGGTSEVAILKSALAAHVLELEWRRFAATAHPRRPRRGERASHVPNHVKREVWMRDRGCCAFVSDDGHACGAREALEFDHIVPLARGGDSRASNVRLLCRTHNQLAAERIFGRRFMEGKRPAPPQA